MNLYLVAAGCLTFIVGFIHSILGEILIFRKMRQKGIIPTKGGSILKERNVRIMWASWHLVTIFGMGLGAIILRLSLPSPLHAIELFVENTILLSMLAASLLVLVATNGKHPGWLGLLGVAILLWIK